MLAAGNRSSGQTLVLENALGRSPMSELIGIAPLFYHRDDGGQHASTAGRQRSTGPHACPRSVRPCHLVVKEAGRSTNPDAPTFEAIAKTSGLTSGADCHAKRASGPPNDWRPTRDRQGRSAEATWRSTYAHIPLYRGQTLPEAISGAGPDVFLQQVRSHGDRLCGQ
jgi:hypothetical protein